MIFLYLSVVILFQGEKQKLSDRVYKRLLLTDFHTVLFHCIIRVSLRRKLTFRIVLNMFWIRMDHYFWSELHQNLWMTYVFHRFLRRMCVLHRFSVSGTGLFCVRSESSLWRTLFSRYHWIHVLHHQYHLVHRPLKERFKRKNLCDGFKNDCLNFADDSISIYSFPGGESVVSVSISNSDWFESIT